MSTSRTTLTLGLALVALSCGGDDWGLIDDPWVGDMSDESYSGARFTARPTAAGGDVSFDEYSGDFVWATYSAPWCGPCRRQVSDMRRLEDAHGERVVFLTILTSDRPGQPATPAAARTWAHAHGLDPAGVMASDLWGKAVPEHRLYSPAGQTLLVFRGYLPADRGALLLTSRLSDWERWSREGERADWMS